MRVIQFTPNRITVEMILQAKEVFDKGGVVAHPTDTVYGLAANMFDENAVGKIYRIKNRNPNQPLSIMVSNKAEIIKLTGGISQLVEKLIDTFLPGPLTLLLPLVKRLDTPYFSDLDFIGFRIPNNELCKDLLTSVKFPLITTSANISGRPVPELGTELLFEFGDDLDLLLDGGKLSGVSSTIIKVEDDKIEIIREGMIPSKKVLTVHV